VIEGAWIRWVRMLVGMIIMDGIAGVILEEMVGTVACGQAREGNLRSDCAFYERSSGVSPEGRDEERKMEKELERTLGSNEGKSKAKEAEKAEKEK